MKQSKRNAKAKSRYYTVRTIRESMEDLTDTLDKYHTRYIKKSVEGGREFVGDIRKDPGKVFGALIDDGKEYMEDFGKDARKKIKNYAQDSRSFLKKTRRNPSKAASELINDGKSRVKDFTTDIRKAVDGFSDSTREIVQGVEKDVRFVMDDLFENGRKTINRIPGKKAVEKTINKRIKAFPARLNLPGRDDLERLGNRMEALNQHVDILHKQLAA